MKAAVCDDFPCLPILYSESVYDTKLVHFVSMCCNTIKWFHKTKQVYYHKIKMVHDSHFLIFNVNDSYNHNMN